MQYYKVNTKRTYSIILLEKKILKMTSFADHGQRLHHNTQLRKIGTFQVPAINLACGQGLIGWMIVWKSYLKLNWFKNSYWNETFHEHGQSDTDSYCKAQLDCETRVSNNRFGAQREFEASIELLSRPTIK